jgi:UDP-2-acetamido-3-amino-2,3-dideoxy-glucuronate N-acetyltransferase
MSLDPSVSVHPAAICETDDVGSGTVIWAFAHLMPGVRVGADCKIADHVFIEGGAVLGDRVTVKNNALLWCGVTIADECFIGPNAVFTNDRAPRVGFPKAGAALGATNVRRGASIGANVTILCGVTIGERAMIGAGSVVLNDVAPFALVVGNPARFTGWCCECGERLDATLTCPCGRRYQLLDQRAGLRLS